LVHDISRDLSLAGLSSHLPCDTTTLRDTLAALKIPVGLQTAPVAETEQRVRAIDESGEVETPAADLIPGLSA